jgi:hypothetical protein
MAECENAPSQPGGNTMRKPDARRPALWFLPAIAFAWAQVAHAEIPEAFRSPALASDAKA